MVTKAVRILISCKAFLNSGLGKARFFYEDLTLELNFKLRAAFFKYNYLLCSFYGYITTGFMVTQAVRVHIPCKAFLNGGLGKARFFMRISDWSFFQVQFFAVFLLWIYYHRLYGYQSCKDSYSM